MRGINGKVVIVTGGAGGIGSAICRRFGAEGATVAVFDINQDAASAVAAEIREKGGKAQAYAVDLTSQDSVITAVTAAEKDLGPTDVLVNNAGWDKVGSFLSTEKPLWDKIVAINLYGALYMHHAVVKGMVARGAGRIVNIASDAGRVGSSGEAVYAFCKGGLIAYSKTMARELARQQISVNVVCPGPTDTPLLDDICGEGEKGDKLRTAFTRAVPFGRLGQPDDLPGAVMFLSSDDASFITGQVLSVSGGLTMAG
ncbi:2-hydroxycyclohexanecarboxyl-CoA dehydrogenase [Aromatoleum diolicum]|uniref:2-hydroxycyclohexanecarboxyl-CoA dehydrogenase n=1 Tax=Aromatoleum diolicum TaxID=75796 RepID=A0ABX1Q9X1_9RHOO|nr:2-hydroxycyclohexanecarboxyl-CoA dehydrogenase [Aromatoleum diolicum]NMG75186.1 2-hydroxycyclohexanecarboxyl-CoA dehydrogenase [Aromatoleum diolicum]